MSIATPSSARVLNPSLERKIMSAAEAAALIRSGDQIGHNRYLRAGNMRVREEN